MEEQFDGHNQELRRIGQLHWTEIADEDLWYYLHDLAYMDLQPDLFQYLFPVCLNFWYASLMRNQSAECGDAEFHYALYRGNVLERMTTPNQTLAIYDFFHDGLLDRIEAERGFVYTNSSTPAYTWIRRFNSMGYVAPITERIWESWWRLDHPGKAVSAIMYATGLVYLKGENPIFAEWTRERGGGGPYLTESDANIFDSSWWQLNLKALKDTLSVEYLQERLKLAAHQLQLMPEGKLAEKIASDASSREDIIQIRIDDLIDGLSQQSPAPWGWDD